MRLRGTLSQRLSLVFALLLLACCGASAWLQMQASGRHEQEVTQRLSAGLAAHIAASNPIFMESGALNRAGVHDLFDKLMAVNPSVEVYMLAPDGRIEAQAAPPGHLKLDRVDLAPIHRLLDCAPLPVLGDDPRAEGRRKVFSAAPLKIDGRDAGFVYVVQSGEEREALAANVAASSVLRTTLWSIALVALLGLLAGLAAFHLITRPLRRLTAAVCQFDSEGAAALEGAAPSLGDAGQGGGDEIAMLGQAFRTSSGASCSPTSRTTCARP